MATLRNTSDDNTQYTPGTGRRNWVWAVVAAIIALLLIYWIASATSHTPDRVGDQSNTNAATTGTAGGTATGNGATTPGQ
ncbi:MAG: hypothetical protein JF571_08740 [Asticcacaulis sp.]|nr:hypothetical protein [Asticcacaulis sp.]